MQKPRTYSPQTLDAAHLLGARVRLARRERRWTVAELAERVGVSHVSIQKVERGDVSVGLGVAFEAATILGVMLFHEQDDRRLAEATRVNAELALLPQRVRRPRVVDNDF